MTIVGGCLIVDSDQGEWVLRIHGFVLVVAFLAVSCTQPATEGKPAFVAVATTAAVSATRLQPLPTIRSTSTGTSAPAPTLTAELTETPIPATATEISAPQIRVAVNTANVRSGPGSEHLPVAFASEGEQLELIGSSEDGSWYQVRLHDGRTGWIGSSVVEVVGISSLADVAVAEVSTSTLVAQESSPTEQATEPAPSSTATSPSIPTATTAPLPTAPEPSPPSNDGIAIVTSITDGDTIHVNLSGQDVVVRYIGIDTPEYNQPCGSEASQANAGLVSGQTVRLVKDVSETDRYDRLLRYVYVGDLFVNAELVRQGWAVAVRYPPDTAQAGYLESQQVGAPVHSCALPTAVPPPPQATQPSPRQNCDPSYPTVCIPSPPPDLDCGEISFRRFQVVGSDPHRFDGDNDGIGCESG